MNKLYCFSELKKIVTVTNRNFFLGGVGVGEGEEGEKEAKAKERIRIGETLK